MWFENLGKFFKNIGKSEVKELEASTRESKETAKERLHMVLMQDRANVSADFLELMKQEIIDVIKKYIEVDEDTIDVRLTTKTNEDGSIGSPSLYANIPILNIRNDMKVENYKFALQSDGSIIAQKIEEPEEDVVAENDAEHQSPQEKLQEPEEDVVAEHISPQEEPQVEENIDEEINYDEIIIEENPVVETDTENHSPEVESEAENKQNAFSAEVEPKGQEETFSTEEVEDTKEDNPLPLKKSARRGRPKKKKSNSDFTVVNSSEESEEEDDDVTFDDLLKAAEEEDRKKAEQEKKEV